LYEEEGPEFSLAKRPICLRIVGQTKPIFAFGRDCSEFALVHYLKGRLSSVQRLRRSLRPNRPERLILKPFDILPADPLERRHRLKDIRQLLPGHYASSPVKVLRLTVIGNFPSLMLQSGTGM
jgi:hypothetical protein